jgi:hypothetical protein
MTCQTRSQKSRGKEWDPVKQFFSYVMYKHAMFNFEGWMISGQETVFCWVPVH